MTTPLTKGFIGLLLFYLVGNVQGQNVKNGFKKLEGFQPVRQQFNSPPMEFAPFVFWFWNDSLNSGTSKYMAREMGKKRMNPGYIHPRHIGKSYGMPIDQYLSEKYFNCIEDVLDVCDSSGTYLGFSDEYWWPSGRIGGRMIMEHPELQARELTWDKWDVPGPYRVYLPPNEFIVACKEAETGVIDVNTLQVISTSKEKEWLVPEGDWSLYVFNVKPSAFRARGADFTLVNYMDPKLMEYTIEMGLKPYEEHLGNYMGKSLKYCFSDNESEYGNRLPWSDYLVTFYQELYGSDIRKWMPLLLTEDNEGKWVTARYSWFNMVSEMYAHKFWKPMNDWLAERGLYYVSNFWEANLIFQAVTVGDYFRVNRALSLPGNDALMMHAYNELHFKEIQSICELEGRFFMSEIMGVQGWQQLPTEMKEVVNLATAWGVSQIVPHGMNLDRNVNDFMHPADWFEENPYWETMTEWTDFCRRTSFINRQGKLAANVLIYNPMTSIWPLSENYLSGRTEGRTNWENETATWINNSYYRVQNFLTEKNIEHLIADDEYIRRSSIDPKNKKIQVMEHPFKTLILPPLFTVARDVFERIVNFAQAGGKVILMGDLPVASAENGLNDPYILELNEKLKSSPSVSDVSNTAHDVDLASRDAAAGISPSIEFESGKFKLYSSRRIIGNNHFYWLANNTGRDQSCTLLLSDGKGKAEKWNCENGEIEPISYLKKDDKNMVRLDFGPYEGFWLVFDESRQNTKIEKSSFVSIPLPAEKWEIRIDAAEVPVTTAYVHAGDKEVNTPDEIAEYSWVSQPIMAPLDVRGFWEARWIKTGVSSAHAYFIYDFSLTDQSVGGLSNITTMVDMELYINGVHVEGLKNKDNFQYVDAFEIGPYLRKGANRIAVKSGKFVSPGTYWLLAQGEIQLSNGATVTITTGNGWLSSADYLKDWNQPDTERKGFSPASTVGWNQLAFTRMQEVYRPIARLVDDNETVWLKIFVPPSAIQFKTGMGFSKAEVWIDGEKSGAITGKEIELDKGTSSIIIKTQKQNLNGWKSPGTFICRDKATSLLTDWSRWGLDRYTGFVEYSMDFEFDQPVNVHKALLDLGELEYVAEVWLNGHKVGSRMWPPFELNITDVLMTGKNQLTVRVGNLATNEMARYYDLGQLYRWGNFGVPESHFYNAGLKGPVQIKINK